jgi:hypothetical protein
MKLEQLLETKTLNQWCNKFNWQGGTIHQIKEELHSRLVKNCSYDLENKEYSCILLDSSNIMFL